MYGFHDMSAMIQRVRRRFAVHMGLRSTAVHWGHIYSQDTGEPLPLASVTLRRNTEIEPVDVAVTDSKGRYGFYASPQDFAATGINYHVAISKSRHYPLIVPVEGSLSSRIFLSAHSQIKEIIRGGSSELHVLERSIERMLFWAAMVTTPVSALADPTAGKMGALAALAVIAVVRGERSS
jgi:hypothetical protein